MKQMNSLAAALLNLVRLDGEGVKAFAAEIRKLTYEDRKWFEERLKIEHNICIVLERAVGHGVVESVAA